jgi:hypothetical protein
VCKRGPMGAAAFTGAIPDSLDAGASGPGFPIEVFNVLGAGDGFMSGLLRGWLTDQDWPTSLTYANACGALAVSRHGCTPAYPSWEELRFFLGRGIKTPALRHDAELEQIHWATNRLRDWPEMRVFAFDHRLQLEAIADEIGVSRDRIGAFKRLCLKATLKVAAGRPGYGLLCDNRLGRDALHAAAGTGRARRQGPRLLSPRRRAGGERRPGGDHPPPCAGGAGEPPGIPARDHPLQGRACHRHHIGRGDPALLRHRGIPRLVEARADEDRSAAG